MIPSCETHLHPFYSRDNETDPSGLADPERMRVNDSYVARFHVWSKSAIYRYDSSQNRFVCYVVEEIVPALSTRRPNKVGIGIVLMFRNFYMFGLEDPLIYADDSEVRLDLREVRRLYNEIQAKKNG